MLDGFWSSSKVVFKKRMCSKAFVVLLIVLLVLKNRRTKIDHEYVGPQSLHEQRSWQELQWKRKGAFVWHLKLLWKYNFDGLSRRKKRRGAVLNTNVHQHLPFSNHISFPRKIKTFEYTPNSKPRFSLQLDMTK